MFRIVGLALCASTVIASPALAGYCPIYVAADKSTLELGRPVDTNVTVTDANGKEMICDAGRMTATTTTTWDMPMSCPKSAGPETIVLDTPDKDNWPTHMTFRDVDYTAGC